MLRDLPKLECVLRAVKQAVSIPVTLKFRAGWDEDSLNYLDTAKIAEACGIAAIALHPRTREQRYTGHADWSRIAAVKRAVRIPVIGSGDVRDAHDALARLHTAGVDGVMIGRAAMSNPWIFLQISQLRRGEPVFQPTPADKCDLLLNYIEMCSHDMPEQLALNKLKQLIGQLALGLPYSAEMRANVQRSREIKTARQIISDYFAPYYAHADLSCAPRPELVAA